MEGTRQRTGIVSPQALLNIPERRSSRHLNSIGSIQSKASHAPLRRQSVGTNILSKGASTSPIRRPDAIRKPPSRTFVPTVWPTEFLDTPTLSSSRASLTIDLSSPVFIGGSTIEGVVHVKIDGGVSEKRRKTKRALSLKGASVTLVGIERCKGRQEIFRVLKTDLVDEDHPPPAPMILNTGLDGCWDMAPSDSTMPFCLDLPVAIGPPPFKSRKFGISYWLSASIEFTVDGKEYSARQSREIVVLTVHDRRS